MSADDRAREIERAVNAATITATVMIAQQIAGKVTRDAVFLSSFDVTNLPPMIIGASVLAILVAVGASRLMARVGPARLIPIGFVASAALLLAEWAAFRWIPQVGAVLVFAHMSSLGGVLISGFWSMINERFDPHTAKKRVGRIAAGANIGALLGGVAAERVAAMVGIDVMLPVMAGMHLFCGWRVLALRPAPDSPSHATEQTPPEQTRSGLQVLAEMSYLRNLAFLLLVGTVAAGLVDYVFKAGAAGAYTDGNELGRFFAIFYTAVNLLTLAFQFGLTTRALEKLGLTRTMATLPGAIVGFGVAALALPGLVTAALVVGFENVLRNSLFRSGYELLYTPVPRAEKRATKLIIDVGFDRIGDALGAGLVAVLLLAGAATAEPLMIGLAIGLALGAAALAMRLHRGYVASLERSLLTQAHALDLDDIRDSTTRLTLLETMGTVDLREALERLRGDAEDPAPAEVTAATAATAASAPATRSDPLLERIAALRSGELERVRQALREPEPLTPTLAPHAIQLLAWDAVHGDAVRALRRLAPAITGQLIDALSDPDEEFAVRRRIPRVLASGDPERALAGLFAGLSDRRFEVRFQCGRAMVQLNEAHPDAAPSREALEEAILRELKVSKRVWDGQRLLDRLEREDAIFLDEADEALATRTSRSLSHVFALLSFLLPRQPIEVAFRGLHTDDPNLRGTALEYLETALPERIRRKLWPFVADGAGGGRQGQEMSTDSLERLLASRESIEINLDELRRRLREQLGGGDGEPG